MWGQQPTPLSPKPDIVLQHYDPMYQVGRSCMPGLLLRMPIPAPPLHHHSLHGITYSKR